MTLEIATRLNPLPSHSMSGRWRELVNKCLHKEPYKLSDFYSHNLQQAQLVDQDVQQKVIYKFFTPSTMVSMYINKRKNAFSVFWVLI